MVGRDGFDFPCGRSAFAVLRPHWGLIHFRSVRIHPFKHQIKEPAQGGLFYLVGRDGFEPSKAVPADLQSAPFGHSGTYPWNVELAMGLEPATC